MLKLLTGQLIISWFLTDKMFLLVGGGGVLGFLALVEAIDGGS